MRRQNHQVARCLYSNHDSRNNWANEHMVEEGEVADNAIQV